MSEIIVYGIPGSPYVRSVLLGLHEKGSPYRLAVLGQSAFAPRTAEHLARHPFGRIPIFQQGELWLYETQAILRYIDAALPGIALQPQDRYAAARMNQVTGIVDSYVFPHISVGICAERFFAERFWKRPTDEANIARALPHARTCVAALEQLQGSHEFLAGDTLSVADLMAAPHLLLFRATPEGRELLRGTSLDPWLTRMGERESVQATEVERLQQAA